MSNIFISLGIYHIAYTRLEREYPHLMQAYKSVKHNRHNIPEFGSELTPLYFEAHVMLRKFINEEWNKLLPFIHTANRNN